MEKDNNYHGNFNLSNYSFLVTGGAGFIGSHLVDYLIRFNARKVIVMDDLSTGTIKNLSHHFDKPNFEFVKSSICELANCEKATQGADYVFHLAARGSVSKSIADPRKTNHVNVTGFLNMLISSYGSLVKRFIYASSSAVYGNTNTFPMSEGEIGKSLSPYAVSKLTNELYAQLYTEMYQFQATGLRFFNVFGTRQNPKGNYAAVIPKFINNILTGEQITIYGDGNQSRDFTYIDDVIQALIKSLSYDFSYNTDNIFNIASGRAVKVNAILNSVKKLLIDSSISEARTNTIFLANRAGDIKHSFASIIKAQTMLGYFSETPIEVHFKAVIEWYLHNQNYFYID